MISHDFNSAKPSTNVQRSWKDAEGASIYDWNGDISDCKWYVRLAEIHRFHVLKNVTEREMEEGRK